MDNASGDQSCSSAHSTPRSSITNASGSPRSYASSSSISGSSNYSFQQKNVKIPPDIRRVDVAILESPLVRHQVKQKLAPINGHKGLDIIKADGLHLPSLTADAAHNNNAPKELKPHPPTGARPRQRNRRGSQQSLGSQSPSDDECRKSSARRRKLIRRKSSNSSRESLNSPHYSDVESKDLGRDDIHSSVASENIIRRGSEKSASSGSLQASEVDGKVQVEYDKKLAMVLMENFNKRRESIEKGKCVDSSQASGETTKDTKNSRPESNQIDVNKATISENKESTLRKSDDEVSLINSYENYLRQLSQKEEDSMSEISNSNKNKKGKLNNDASDEEETSSESGSDDSSSSISVSSLSGDEDENLSLEDENTLKFNANLEPGDKFEPLYSLPIKDKKKDNLTKPLVNDAKSELNSSMLSETSKHRYAILDESLQSGELRTQSVPDLRTGRSFRTLDTMGYMCPRVLNVDRQPISSPELKHGTLNLKYRPLPDIPLGNTQRHDGTNIDNGESIYESIETRDMSLSSPSKPKISFKAVANRVVSLMPRLTTREARSREADKYMADIMQYLPDQTLRVYCGTWNMKGIKVMPDSLDDYILPHESIFIQDIYAIGCQEGTPFRKEWEIRLQETLGPTHVLMYSGNFGVLHLSIFVRRELVWFCTGIEQDTVATRIAHKFKTKGAIAVCFNLFGTSLLFINSHFASNQEKLKERVNDYRTIIRSLNIPFGEETVSKESDVTSRFDRVFWFGDFNFRINKKRAEADEVFAKRDFDDREQRKTFIIKELVPHDQLCHLVEKGKIFHGFREAPINFLPTYKFDVNTDTYDTSQKARVQSWTDRVLFKSKQPDDIKVTSYNSCTTIKCSDHRPVYCIMEAKIEPCKRNVQLPGAMFDRDIYIEANLRRSAPKGSQHSSNVCIIL